MSSPGASIPRGAEVARLIREDMERRVDAGESPGVAQLSAGLSGLLGMVPGPACDRSRPVGRLRRAMLTRPEYLGMSGDPGVSLGATLSRLGLPSDARLAGWGEPRLAAGCVEYLVESGSFDEVYFGQAVPVHAVPSAAAPAPAPAPAAPRRPAPESIS